MSSLLEYLKGSYYEFKDKVEWPKWPDLQSATTVVAITTVILSIFTFGVDYFFSNSLKNLLNMLINLFN